MIRAEPANADILNISDAILPDGGRGTRIELRDGRVLYVTRTKLRTSAATAKRKREARAGGAREGEVCGTKLPPRIHDRALLPTPP